MRASTHFLAKEFPPVALSTEAVRPFLYPYWTIQRQRISVNIAASTGRNCGSHSFVLLSVCSTGAWVLMA